MKLKLRHFTLGVALCLLGASGYFSVYGLSYLFAGAKISVIIMASTLEISKIVATSFLYRWRKAIPKSMKIYLIPAIGILMLITSIGIYGYLSNAYQQTSAQLTEFETELEVYQSQKSTYQAKLVNLDTQIQYNQNRLNTLNNVRDAQEKRLSRIIETFNKRMISEAREDIQKTNSEIQTIQDRIDSFLKQKNETNQQILTMDTKNVDLAKRSNKIDVGPLRFLSGLFKIDMNKIVHILILCLIFTFDPLAVILIVATNMQLEKEVGKSLTIDTVEKKNRTKTTTILSTPPKKDPNKPKRKYVHTEEYWRKKRAKEHQQQESQRLAELNELEKRFLRDRNSA